MSTDDDHGRSQAKAQYESICEMVAALDCDYDRLEELRDEREALVDAVKEASEIIPEGTTERIASQEEVDAREALDKWDLFNGDELRELTEAAGDYTSREEADEAIKEDPLSLQVRGGWYSPGEEKPDPEEFEILLCTGGPACRILGELDEHNQPDRAWLEYQDWFTPWTRYFDASQDKLLAYCRQFYFGD